jgi:YegS/Rv2252/BmrU family lipid kinase
MSSGMEAAAGAAERKAPFIVVNPNSAGGETGRRWRRLEAEVRAVLGEVAVAMTSRPMEAAELTRRALLDGHRTVLAVGGDGTLNEVVNGFFHEDGTPVAPDAAVGLLPRGTGGDFRKTAGVPADFAAAVRHVAAARPRRIDVGRIRYRAHDGRDAVRHFVNVASFGISGTVDERVNASSKWLGGTLSFNLASLRALLGWRDVTVRVRVDGGVPEALPITCVSAANGRFFGGGMMVAPDARLDDGLLHLTFWSGYGVGTFLFRQAGIYSGAHLRWGGTRAMAARKIEAESDARVLVDVDGEQPGTLPACIELLPGAIGLVA